MSDTVTEQTTSPSFPLLTERPSVELHSSLSGEVGWGCSLEDGRGGCLKEEKIKFVEYNRAYIDYAKQNRKIATKAERIFWCAVKNKQLLWYKFRRQKVVWSFILDFYCSKLLLWIELDGWYRNDRAEYDLARDSEIYKKRILVIRFRNEDIENNLDWVISELEEIIKTKKSSRLEPDYLANSWNYDIL